MSIGLVNIGTGLFTLTEVLSVADAACYMAKERGATAFTFSSRKDSELVEPHRARWSGFPALTRPWSQGASACMRKRSFQPIPET